PTRRPARTRTSRTSAAPSRASPRTPRTRRSMAELTRRAFLGAGAAVAATAMLPRAARWQPCSRAPNNVYVLADDLGYGALGSYGQTTIRTPNLDRLAGEGIRFTDCYSAAPICAPSRCCFLTGMHNGHARVRDNSFT